MSCCDGGRPTRRTCAHPAVRATAVTTATKRAAIPFTFATRRPRRPSAEDDRPVARDQHPALEGHPHGVGEGATFELAPFAHELVDVVAVGDPADVLFDDRPLIELAGHVMRGRADHLHP